MATIKETEQIHPILGSIRFDNGEYDPKIGIQNAVPFWVARPMGWLSSGVEILLPGDPSGPAPDTLNRAIQVFNSLEKIEKAGSDLIHTKIMKTTSPNHDVAHNEIRLLWIDCQHSKTKAIFIWESFAYVRWEAILSETNKIINLKETTW